MKVTPNLKTQDLSSNVGFRCDQAQWSHLWPSSSWINHSEEVGVSIDWREEVQQDLDEHGRNVWKAQEWLEQMNEHDDRIWPRDPYLETEGQDRRSQGKRLKKNWRE